MVTLSRAVKSDFLIYIRRYSSTNENVEHGYPHSSALIILFFQRDSENVVYAVLGA